MEKVTDLRSLDFGTKVIVEFSKDEIYHGVVFGRKVGYEDGFVDLISTLENSVTNEQCVVYYLQ